MPRIQSDSGFCRALAVGAWLALAAWFCVALSLSWGWAPGAFALWTLPALLLAAATGDWLQRAGRPVPLRVLTLAGSAWTLSALVVAVAFAGRYAPDPRLGLADDGPLVASLAGPAVVTAVALWAAVRRTHPAA